MIHIVKKIDLPEAGIFLGLDRSGKVWKKKPDPSRRTGGFWSLYEEDVLSLALEGRVHELELLQELIS